MWSLFLSNLSSSLSDDSFRSALQSAEGGSDLFDASLARDRETGECKGYGFAHYTSRESFMRALDAYRDGLDIDGRKARAAVAEDKRKLYVRNLPRDMSEEEIKRGVEDIAGKYEAIAVRGGQTTHNTHRQAGARCDRSSLFFSSLRPHQACAHAMLVWS